MVALLTLLLTPSSRSEEFSLGSAVKYGATGNMARLERYAEAMRTGFIYGLLQIDGNQLVDVGTYAASDQEAGPLLRPIIQLVSRNHGVKSDLFMRARSTLSHPSLRHDRHGRPIGNFVAESHIRT